MRAIQSLPRSLVSARRYACASKARIVQIKQQIEEATSDYDKEKLQERI